MQTVILPGGAINNKDWVKTVAENLTLEGTVRPVSWDHWLDPKEKFDPKEKALLISRHTRGDTLNIIAKSIGTLVATYIIEAIPAQIHKVILCGIPLTDLSAAEQASIKKTVESLDKTKLLCFQNESDPHGSFAEVKKLLPQDVKLLSRPRSDHSYPYYEEFNKFLTD